MAKHTADSFVTSFKGQTLKWQEVTAQVGISTASALKKDGKIEKTDAGWLVR